MSAELLLLTATCMLTGAVLILGRLPLAAVLALHVLAYGSFFALIVRLRRHRTLGPGVVWAAAVALMTLAVARPPLQSHDLWSYVFYGRMVVQHGTSPYRQAPSAFSQDPFFAHVDPAWRRARSVYGPVFTAMSMVLVRVAGSSSLTARVLFQSVAAGATLASAAIVHRVTRSVAAVALVVLNPLVVVGVVNAGHNDALVGLGLLGAVLIAARGRPVCAGLVLAAAALVKITALLAAGALLLWLYRHFRLRRAVAFGSAVVVATALGMLLAGGRAAVKPLNAASARVTSASPWSGFERAAAAEDMGEHTTDERAFVNGSREASVVADVVVLLVAAGLALRWTKAASPATAVIMCVAAFLLLAPYVLPPYMVWVLPLAAVGHRHRWTLVGLLYAALLHLAYVPDFAAGVFFAGSNVAGAAAQSTLRTIALPIVAVVLAVVIAWAPKEDAVLGGSPALLDAGERRSEDDVDE